MGNSVIYRPAYDAEVEYLESTGTQRIDTNVIPASGWKIEIEYMVTQMGCFLFGARTSYFSSDAFSSHIDSLGIYIQYDGNQERINGVGNSLNQRYKLIMSADGAFLDDVKIRDANSNTFTCPCNLYLFTLRQPNVDGTDRSFKGYIYYCKLWDNTNTLVRDFIPVRIGSVGYMYDKVSKQLFGNKGTGQFILGSDVSNAVIPQQRCVLYFGNQRSVVFERIYEEYEWLCGDGSAYLYLGEVSNYIEFDADIPQADIQFRFVYGNNGALRVYMANQVFSALVDANKIKNYNTPLQSKIKIDLNTHLAYSNGEAFAHTNLGAGANGESAFKSAFFFGNYNQATSVFRGKCAIGNVDMDGNVFIPCKLLQSIPAILDGNEIARQAGECGMWDKVNNVFYGNVASSGSFTVSND